MARTILTAALIVLLNVLVGCQRPDSGISQRRAIRTGTSPGYAVSPELSKAGETDIVEQVVINRQAYREGLAALVAYYGKEGDHMRLTWARKELGALNTMPQYNYIIEASVAPANLRATTAIPEADYLYREALELESKSGFPYLVLNENMLRLALDRYNQLIRNHPASDKIDDAAYKAGLIYDHFKDYMIARLYFQRAYQWDPETPYPARFKEAQIWDIRLHDRAKALELYERALRAVRIPGEHKQWEEWAQKRIKELTKVEEPVK